MLENHNTLTLIVENKLEKRVALSEVLDLSVRFSIHFANMGYVATCHVSVVLTKSSISRLTDQHPEEADSFEGLQEFWIREQGSNPLSELLIANLLVGILLVERVALTKRLSAKLACHEGLEALLTLSDLSELFSRDFCKCRILRIIAALLL